MFDPIAQLKSLKTNPKAGWVLDVKKENSRALLMEAIGHKEQEVNIAVSVRAYSTWMFTDFISKPLAAGVAVFVILLGGWMTTVSAASNSLPGDTLYQVKMITEQAKLKLASSEQKAILHTEFAQIRLDEAVTLSETGSDAQAQVAMEAFKSEVALAENSIRQLQESGNTQTVQVAFQVDQKLTELSTSIENKKTNTATAPLTTTGAEKVTRDASDSVVDIMVETHETSATAKNTISLETRFRNGITEIKTRQTYDLGRLSVIKTALSNEELSKQTGIDNAYIDSLTFSVEHSTERLSEAMDLMANGGVRAAFDILVTINQSLANAESSITQTEINISVASADLANAQSNTQPTILEPIKVE